MLYSDEINFELLTQSGSNAGQRLNGGAAGAVLNAADVGLPDAGFLCQLLLGHVAFQSGGNHRPDCFLLRPLGFIFGRKFRIVHLLIQILPQIAHGCAPP